MFKVKQTDAQTHDRHRAITSAHWPMGSGAKNVANQQCPFFPARQKSNWTDI